MLFVRPGEGLDVRRTRSAYHEDEEAEEEEANEGEHSLSVEPEGLHCARLRGRVADSAAAH